MPMFSRAESVDHCIDELKVLNSGLETSGYGDAADEIEAAMGHLEIAAKILRAPEET